MKLLVKIRNGFLKFFGDIKIFKYPFFLLYDPGSYLVKGHDIRQVIEKIKPGDIMIRGYKNYLDGYFIPGYFSHAGLYLGLTSKEGLDLNPKQEEKFYEGKQVVIHSMAEGVFMEDVINFCRCDFLVVLRRNKTIEPETDLKEAFKETYKRAIENLGKEYDFKFDFINSETLSCTELVQVCYTDIMPQYDVSLKNRRVLFSNRKMLIPDDFITDKFKVVFASSSIDDMKINEIINRNRPANY